MKISCRFKIGSRAECDNFSSVTKFPPRHCIAWRCTELFLLCIMQRRQDGKRAKNKRLQWVINNEQKKNIRDFILHVHYFFCCYPSPSQLRTRRFLKKHISLEQQEGKNGNCRCFFCCSDIVCKTGVILSRGRKSCILIFLLRRPDSPHQ